MVLRLTSRLCESTWNLRLLNPLNKICQCPVSYLGWSRGSVQVLTRAYSSSFALTWTPSLYFGCYCQGHDHNTDLYTGLEELRTFQSKRSFLMTLLQVILENSVAHFKLNVALTKSLQAISSSHVSQTWAKKGEAHTVGNFVKSPLI